MNHQMYFPPVECRGTMETHTTLLGTRPDLPLFYLSIYLRNVRLGRRFHSQDMLAAALIFLWTLLISVSGTCLNPVSCPCGTSSNRNSTICAENVAAEDSPCALLSNCETCRDELNRCWTCPPGFHGPICSESHRVSRRKRQTQIGDCPLIYSPSNGEMKCRNAIRRGYCRATCNSGFTFENNESEPEIILECRRGSWYPLPAFPSCVGGVVESDCRDPGTPEGVTRYPPRRPYPGLFEEEEQIQFGCSDIDAEIEGESVLTCQKDGKWSAPLPRCVIKQVNEECPFPGVDPNGQVVIRGRAPGPIDPDATFPAGTRLVYTCNRGFTRDGSSAISCRPTGEWSNNYPYCVSDDPGPEPSAYCPNLGPVHHGTLTLQLSSRASNPDVELPAGTSVQYECRRGYTLQGSAKITCGEDGQWSGRLPQCVEACGLRSAEVDGLVTHGDNTTKGEWPWVVSVSLVRDNRSHIVCGASLLDRRTVLTAAHCLTEPEGSYYLLHFGKYYRSTLLDDNRVQVRRSQRVIIHPDYNPVTYDNDIAVVRFSPPVRYDGRILPICPPTPESTRDNLKPGTIGIVTGWGRNELDTDPDSLMMARLPVQSDSTCSRTYRDRGLTFDPATMVCAGYPQGGTSTCRGDSGSGLVFRDVHSEGRFTVEGVVSYNLRGSCGMPGRYTAFTKVGVYMDWVRRNVQ